MTLTPELIEHAKKQVQIEQYFKEADVAIPKHILHQQFQQGTKWQNLPKIIFYILMDDLYWKRIAKAPNGDLGYMLELIDQPLTT